MDIKIAIDKLELAITEWNAPRIHPRRTRRGDRAAGGTGAGKRPAAAELAAPASSRAPAPTSCARSQTRRVMPNMRCSRSPKPPPACSARPAPPSRSPKATAGRKIIRVGDSSKRVGADRPGIAQLRIGGNNMPGTIVAENRQVHVPDLDNVDPAIADWPGLRLCRARPAPVRCPVRRCGARARRSAR